MACQKIFGEGLGALELSSCLSGAKTAEFLLAKEINDAGYQRCLGSHYGEGAILLLGETRKTFEVHHIKSDILDACFPMGTRIARRNKHAAYVFCLRQLPGQRVLAPTTAHN